MRRFLLISLAAAVSLAAVSEVAAAGGYSISGASSGAPSGSATGDLGGTYPAPTVLSAQNGDVLFSGGGVVTTSALESLSLCTAGACSGVLLGGASGTTAAFAVGTTLSVGTVNAVTSVSEHDFAAYRATKATPAATVVIARTKVTNASTLTTDSTITPDVVGVGGGNFVVRLCSDGTTCGAGNIYLTCTLGCTGVVGTPVACTVTKSAVAAATTLSWEVGTACATTDPGVALVAHLTTP